MKNDFHIVIIDITRKDENELSDYHMEKIFSDEEALACLNDPDNYDYYSDFLIITNSHQLVQKYERAMYVQEFEMLCKPELFQKWNTRVSLGFRTYDGYPDIFDNLMKLLNNNDLISINTLWTYYEHYPWDDFGPAEFSRNFEKWGFNNFFRYFKTPIRYKDIFDNNGCFSPPNLDITSLIKIEKILNINILDIKNNLSPKLTWNKVKGFLKYFDKKTQIRFYIRPKDLSLLETDMNAELIIETRIDENYYLEYFVVGLLSRSFEYSCEEKIALWT